MNKSNMKNESYIIDGVELSLDKEMLEQYSKLTVAGVGSDIFNTTLKYLAEIELQTDSFEKAVYLYGSKVVSKKITSAIKEELDTFTVEYDD